VLLTVSVLLLAATSRCSRGTGLPWIASSRRKWALLAYSIIAG